MMPNDVRTAAAKDYELRDLLAWGKLTWAARYVVVRDYCAQHGHQCYSVPSVDAHAPAGWISKQQARNGRLAPPPLDTVGLAAGTPTNGHTVHHALNDQVDGRALDHLPIQPSNGHSLGHVPVPGTDLHSPGAEKLRLKAIFSTTDSLQLLLRHHLEPLARRWLILCRREDSLAAR
jgi:hypothetical protein